MHRLAPAGADPPQQGRSPERRLSFSGATAPATHRPVTLESNMLVDTRGDGLPDAKVMDTTGDGRPDTIVYLNDRSAAEPAASTAVAAAASSPEPPTKRQRSEAEAGSAAGSDGRATGGERAGSGGPPPRLQTKPYDDLRGHTGFLLFCTKHVGDGVTEA